MTDALFVIAQGVGDEAIGAPFLQGRQPLLTESLQMGEDGPSICAGPGQEWRLRQTSLQGDEAITDQLLV